jgi:hypothetical protein
MCVIIFLGKQNYPSVAKPKGEYYLRSHRVLTGYIYNTVHCL